MVHLCAYAGTWRLAPCEVPLGLNHLLVQPLLRILVQVLRKLLKLRVSCHHHLALLLLLLGRPNGTALHPRA